MKKLKKYSLLAAASAPFLFGAVPAHAYDYGCTVLLCLANPAGPQAVADCVQPINQLWNDLLHLHPFPTCVMGSAGSGTYAQQNYSWYDDCPTGTTELPFGQQAIEMNPQAYQFQMGWGYGQQSSSTIYSGLNYQNIGWGNGGGPKACVSGLLGTAYVQTGHNQYANVNAYTQIIPLPMYASPNIIDVYISGSLSRRVRW